MHAYVRIDSAFEPPKEEAAIGSAFYVGHVGLVSHIKDLEVQGEFVSTQHPWV